MIAATMTTSSSSSMARKSTRRAIDEAQAAILYDAASQALEGSQETVSIADVALIPVEQLTPNPFQPRRLFKAEELKNLSDDIGHRAQSGQGLGGTGILQPLVVRRPHGAVKGQEGRVKSGIVYQIIAGERRFQAGKMAGLKAFPCTIQDMDDDRALEVGLIENIQREDLTPLEEGLAVAALMNLKKLSVRKVAVFLNKDRGWVDKRISLVRVDEDVRRLITERPDTIRVAQLINPVRDPELRRKLIASAKSGTPYREIEQRIKAAKTPWQLPAEASQVDAKPHLTFVKSEDLNGTSEGTVSMGSPKEKGVLLVPKFDVAETLDFILSQLARVEREVAVVDLPRNYYAGKVVPRLNKIREASHRIESLRKK